MEPTHRVTFPMCHSHKIQTKKIKKNIYQMEKDLNQGTNERMTNGSHESMFVAYKRPSPQPLQFLLLQNPSLLRSLQKSQLSLLNFMDLATAQVLVIALPATQISSFRVVYYGANFKFENGFLRFFRFLRLYKFS